MEWNDDQFVWSPIFIRYLHKSEENHLFCLLDVLRQLPTPKVGRGGKGELGREDFGLPLKMMSSLLSSFYLAMSNHPSERQTGYLWKSKVPPKVLAFGWLVLQGSSLAMANLCRNNACQGIGGSSSSHLCNNSSNLELVS
eukprot:TRINITY_DN12648_c2_g1_i1.p1 TRINITY_DN12648_c2_g1~~TRINITY_DN12648_c2_g1_i1.p1  ORF type:complete len:140 (-),score=32.37 TRINITY_DN12648_c2_g1_i1:446-865(-)